MADEELEDLLRVALNYAMPRMPTPQDAEDVASEVMLKYVTPTEYDGQPPAEPAAFVIGITRNVIAEWYRRGGGRRFVPLTDDLDMESESAGSAFQAADERQVLNQVLAELPERERHVLVMRVLGGFGNKDIAEKFRIGLSNAAVTFHRGKAHARSAYERFGNGYGSVVANLAAHLRSQYVRFRHVLEPTGAAGAALALVGALGAGTHPGAGRSQAPTVIGHPPAEVVHKTAADKPAMFSKQRTLRPTAKKLHLDPWTWPAAGDSVASISPARFWSNTVQGQYDADCGDAVDTGDGSATSTCLISGHTDKCVFTAGDPWGDTPCGVVFRNIPVRVSTQKAGPLGLSAPTCGVLNGDRPAASGPADATISPAPSLSTNSSPNSLNPVTFMRWTRTSTFRVSVQDHVEGVDLSSTPAASVVPVTVAITSKYSVEQGDASGQVKRTSEDVDVATFTVSVPCQPVPSTSLPLSGALVLTHAG
ncbi:MAG: hypothetical protein QOC82_803 [Frankiaceae bacterium]|jgi:RNA polymerase sigma-70 factor (ECF subfamily)|nr:hypothetical protein [Frankiaceae bacterium]